MGRLRSGRKKTLSSKNLLPKVKTKRFESVSAQLSDGDTPSLNKSSLKEIERMKREELKALGLSEEQIDKVLNMHHTEIDPVKKELETAQGDLTAEKEKVTTQETTIKDLKKDLEGFKDVDVSGLQQKITDLENDLKTKDEDYQSQIADRDFQAILKDSIVSAKGKNQKAISALLDVDVLKQSKNQKEDIAAAIKALTEAEDSKMLFGEPEGNPVGTGSPIGNVGGKPAGDMDAVMRAAMGLSTTEGDK